MFHAKGGKRVPTNAASMAYLSRMGGVDGVRVDVDPRPAAPRIQHDAIVLARRLDRQRSGQGEDEEGEEEVSQHLSPFSFVASRHSPVASDDEDEDPDSAEPPRLSSGSRWAGCKSINENRKQQGTRKNGTRLQLSPKRTSMDVAREKRRLRATTSDFVKSLRQKSVRYKKRGNGRKRHFQSVFREYDDGGGDSDGDYKGDASSSVGKLGALTEGPEGGGGDGGGGGGGGEQSQPSTPLSRDRDHRDEDELALLAQREREKMEVEERKEEARKRVARLSPLRRSLHKIDGMRRVRNEDSMFLAGKDAKYRLYRLYHDLQKEELRTRAAFMTRVAPRKRERAVLKVGRVLSCLVFSALARCLQTGQS